MFWSCFCLPEPNPKSKIENPKLVHLITLSARPNTFGGIVRPIRLAAFKLITFLANVSMGSQFILSPVYKSEYKNEGSDLLYDTSLGLKVPKYSEVEQLIRFYLAFNPIAGALKPKNLFEISIRWNSSTAIRSRRSCVPDRCG